SIQEYGWFAGSAKPFTVGVRVGVAAAQDLDVFQAHLPHLGAGQVCRLIDFFLVFAIRADTRNGDQVGEAANQGSMVFREPIQDGHGTSPRKKSNEENLCIGRVVGKPLRLGQRVVCQPNRSMRRPRNTMLPMTAAAMLARRTAPAAISRQQRRRGFIASSRPW